MTLPREAGEGLTLLAAWLGEDPSTLLAEAVRVHVARVNAAPHPLARAAARAGLTQHELAARVHVTPGFITHMAHGRKRPAPATAARIGRELGISTNDVYALLPRSERKTQHTKERKNG